MRSACVLIVAFPWLLGTVRGESTIDPTHPFAWSGNTGWTNWRANAVDGARTGEYVLSGAIWLSNAGWVQLGDGTPADSVRYQNNSATDFGVNLHEDFTLRGFAYGANIGWLQFEPFGNPRIDPATGRLMGYAWSANLGWINLGNSSSQYLATLSIPMSPDLDTDGISDAWELEMAGELKTLTQTGDYDADGLLDLDEYAADSNPLDSSDGTAHHTVHPGWGNHASDPGLDRSSFANLSHRNLPRARTRELDGVYFGRNHFARKWDDQPNFYGTRRIPTFLSHSRGSTVGAIVKSRPLPFVKQSGLWVSLKTPGFDCDKRGASR